jgi:hypothetical protein
MKYLTPLIVIALVAFTGYATYLFMPETVEECCEYLGLLAPEGVSETPGVEHVEFEAATTDGSIPDTLPGLKMNGAAGEVTLPDIDGNTHTIDFSANKFTVIVWVSSFCPTSKIYEERLNSLAADFAGDVKFWAVNSSAMESLEELRAHFKDGDADRLRLTVLKEEGSALADRFGARVSTECFVFDSQGRLQYRGGIDDARNPQRVSVRYLRLVLKQLIAGKAPDWRYLPAKGCCPIDKLGADEPEPEPAKVQPAPEQQ